MSQTRMIAAVTLDFLQSGQAALIASYGVSSLTRVAGGQMNVTLPETSPDETVFSYGGSIAGAVTRLSAAEWSIQVGDPGTVSVVWYQILPGADGNPPVITP